MSKITKKFNPKFPHFKKTKHVKTKQKYFLIVSRTISKYGKELKSNCILMKTISKNKLQALKLLEINRNLLKKYSKQFLLYPTNKKKKCPWNIDIPVALQKEVKKIINSKPGKIVMNDSAELDDIDDDDDEIQEYDDESVDTDDMIIHVSSSSSESSSPIRLKSIQSDVKIQRFIHVLSHTQFNEDQMELECQTCSRKFKQQISLDLHIKKQHLGIEIQNEFSCTQCDKMLKCKRSLKEHLKIHDVSKYVHKCLECNKTFTNAVYLSRHKETHLIDCEYDCETCHKKFKNKNLLKSHQSVHSNKLGFSCDICNHSFKYFNSLTRHKKSHHTLADNRCGICGASFIDRKLFLRHSFEHADEPFVECNICSKRFFKENHLLEHIKSHNDEYVDCNQCKKTVKKDQFEQHNCKVNLAPNKKFVCPHCKQAFTRSSNLKKHILKHVKYQEYQNLPLINEPFIL